MRNGSIDDIDSKIIKDTPLVSIVVPVYNTADGLLRRCLESLFSQDYCNIEFIVIDDGSDDACVATLNKAIAHEPRARLVEGQHKGASHSRNIGIEIAAGEWLAFADADDELEPNFISEALKVAMAEGVDYVCGGVDWRYEDGVSIGSGYSHDYCVFDDPRDLASARMQMLGPMKYKHFMGPNFRGRGPIAKLYRRSLLAGLRYDTGLAMGEDALFNYRYIERCRSLAVVEALWYHYYQYKGSTIHSVDVVPWIKSIDGILSSHEDGESWTPFVSRCALITTQGLDAIFRSGAAWKDRARGVELIAYARDRGCFSENCWDGYETRVWITAYIWLCRHGFCNLAYWLWGIKTFLLGRLSNRRLIDPSSVVRSI